MTRRRPTVELQAIIMREKVFASPPPAPAGTSLRAWFAGLALGNPEVMRDVEPGSRVMEALRVADQLIAALETARVPTLESMAAPSEEEMQKWDAAVAEANETRERQTRATMPELRVKKQSRTKTLMGVAIDPQAQAPQPPTEGPPTIKEPRKVVAFHVGVRAGSIPPPVPLPKREPDAGRYTVVIKESSTVQPPKKR